MRKLVLRVKSVGCPGCIATALAHLFRIKGVRGARVVGLDIIVLLDDETDPRVVLEDPVLNEYYRIISWRLEEYKGDAALRRYSLAQS